MKKQWGLVGLTVLAAACGGDEGGGIDAREAVDVVVSTAERLPTSADFAATITAERVASIATRTSGTVREVRVDLGDRVAEGDVLVTLDDRDIEARVDAARAAVAFADKTHGRIERLARDGAASRQELDRTTAELEAARSALREAEAQRAYTVVRAPFAGVVTRRDIDPGDLAGPGVPLLSLIDPGVVKFVADLPSRLAGTVTVGDPVSVVIGDRAGAVEGRITRVVPSLGARGTTFRVEAVADGPLESVYAGVYARLRLPGGDVSSPWIPEDAIVERGQLRGVFAVEDGVLRLRWLRLGETRGGAVEVLAGAGDELTVVRRPGVGLEDGLTVGTSTAEAWSPKRIQPPGDEAAR